MEPDTSLLPVQFQLWIWPEAEASVLPSSPKPDIDSLFRSLSRLEKDFAVDIAVERYRKTREFDETLVGWPQIPEVVDRIAKPLHDARYAYVVGHFMSCIALCGAAAEAFPQIVIKRNPLKMNGKVLSAEEQRDLFGMAASKLKHTRRVQLLKRLGILTPEASVELEEIAKIRNQYLHDAPSEQERHQADSLKCFKMCVQLLAPVFGLHARNNSFATELHPFAHQWLKELSKNDI